MNTSLDSALRRPITRRLGFGLATATLLSGLAPAAWADHGRSDAGEQSDDFDPAGSMRYDVDSYIKTSTDSGGYGARVKLGSTDHFQVRFAPYGERLEVWNFPDRSWDMFVLVEVYEHMDGVGVPHNLLDRDRFRVGHGRHRMNLGTPDGSGNIPEGCPVVIRMKGENWGSWSPPAYGVA